MRSLALLACEKIIRDALGGPSLIATFQEMNLQIPPETKFPSNAVIPKEWAIFALWQITDDEMRHTYSQTVEIVWPDGVAFLKQTIPVPTEKPDWISAIMNLSAFPAGQPGKIVIRVWMELEGQKISDTVETFIRVNHGVLNDNASININQ